MIPGLPEDALLTDPDSMAGYVRDWTRHEPGVPRCVARPGSAAEVQAVLRWATGTGTPVVTRGAGSGLSGGAVAIDGCVVLSTERMTAIKVDPQARIVVAQPGALNKDVKTAAAREGLWYPPDPSSYEISTIGGNVATNAGGLCCVKYGVTRDYVLGLEVVLADGRLVRLGGRRVKDVAGLDLVRLFVGSEGTLGVITEVNLRVLPAQTAPVTMAATFADVTAAARAVVAIGQRLRPALMELMDHTAINAVEDFKPHGLDRSAGALLIAQSDADGATRARELEEMTALCREAGASDVTSSDDPDDSEAFLAARRSAAPAVEAMGAVLREDVGVPVPELPALLARIGELGAEHGVTVSVVAHAGDGNVHPNIVFRPGEEEKARRAFVAIARAAIALGGTITGEHGVGRTKLEVLEEQLGRDVIDLNRRIKAALDPQNLLNPGVLIPPR